MSLLDELARGVIDYSHMCKIKTKYGTEPRTDKHKFAYDNEVGKVIECVCGREFVVVRRGAYAMWEEKNVSAR